MFVKKLKVSMPKNGSDEGEIFAHSLCQEIIKELWALSNLF